MQTAQVTSKNLPSPNSTEVMIDYADIQPIVELCRGNQTFDQTVRQIERGEELLRVVSRYIQFNSIFGSGVANLAGEVGARQELFRDGGEAVAAMADRSVEVAAAIFYAAIDEFGGSQTLHRATHRTLAQATLRATGDFLGCELADFNRLLSPHEATLKAIGRVCAGYGLNRALTEPQLFRAIGFHIGSEALADEEFNLLDRALHDEHAELVDYLKRTKITINGTQNAAYRWIYIHTSVEADHFGAAVVSANLALRYYAGTASKAQVKDWILEGVREFAATQTQFMESLLEH